MVSQQTPQTSDKSSTLNDVVTGTKTDTNKRPLLKHQPTATYSSTGSPPVDCTSPDIQKQDTTLSSHSLTLSHDNESLREGEGAKALHSPLDTNDPPSTTSGTII